MAKANEYLTAMGYNVNRASQNKPFVEWLVSKMPAAGGGLFAHWVYQKLVTDIFSKQAKVYGPDIVGSIGLAIIAYILDHNLWGWREGFSDDLTQSFTDGMMGRGAPAVMNTANSVWEFLIGTVSGKKTAGNALPSASLDRAPEALADMMALLADSPDTRRRLADDLVTAMERQDMRVDDTAKRNLANCINDLATQYKR